MQMRLNPFKAFVQIILHQARFRQHGKGCIEFFTADKVKFPRQRLHMGLRLRFHLMPRFDQIAEQAAAKREKIVEEGGGFHKRGWWLEVGGWRRSISLLL